MSSIYSAAVNAGLTPVQAKQQRAPAIDVAVVKAAAQPSLVALGSSRSPSIAFSPTPSTVFYPPGSR